VSEKATKLNVRRIVVAALMLAAAIGAGRVLAQQGSGPLADWLTDGGDPQRTAWQKNERILTVSNVKNLTLRWKYKTDNQPREMHALFPPLIVGQCTVSPA